MIFPFRLIPKKTNIDFLSKKNYAFALSISLTILTFILFFTKGLNFAIDFVGGTIIEMKSKNQEINVEDIKQNLEDNGYHSFDIQSVTKGDQSNILLRLPVAHHIDEGGSSEDSDGAKSQKNSIQNIRNIITEQFKGEVEFSRIEYVGPKISQGFVWNSFIAFTIAIVAMMLYTWFRFNWEYGIGVMAALIHDAIITTGFYLITGYEFNLTSIAVILTVVGYSINDSVVIYDRIRENIHKYQKKLFYEIINLSINETLSRTVMTLSTTLIVCLIIGLFGGPSLHEFGIALSFGIAFGGYSSVYISASILTLFGAKQKLH